MDKFLQEMKSKILNDELDVVWNKKRMYFPDAKIFVPGKIIIIEGNEPSFIRYTLLDMLIHELTHYKLYLDGEADWKEHNDKFWITYGRLRKKFYEDLFGEEDEI